MFQIIPKTYADLPQELIDEEVWKIENKCKVDGKIIDVKYWAKEEQCFQNIELILLNWDNYYKFNSVKLYQECTSDWWYQIYFDIPKWKMQYIVSDKDYKIISNNLQDYAKYTTPKCEINYSQKEYIMEYWNIIQKVNYYYENNFYIIWIILLVIILLIWTIYKKIKSRN